MKKTGEIIPVRPGDERLETVARLHLELLPFGPMSPFGKRFVKVVGYGLPLRDGLMDLACLEIDGEIAGFIAFARDARGFYSSAIGRHVFSIGWQAVRSLLARPTRLAALGRAIRFARERSAADDLGDDVAEITAIAVRPEYSGADFVRSTGIRVSRDLVGYALQEVSRHGARRLRGVIDGFNKPAVMMFGQMGATISSFEQAGEPMYEILFETGAD